MAEPTTSTERNRLWRQKHPDRYREYQRNYKRKIRAAKKGKDEKTT